MNIKELTDFLEMVVSADNRIPSDEMFAIWGGVLRDVAFKDAVTALYEHLGTSTEYLMPIHIKTIAKRLVKERIENTREPLPPEWALASGKTYARWKRGWLDEVKAGTYVPPPEPELVRRDVRAIANTFRTPADVEPVPGEDAPAVNDSPEEQAA